MFVMSVTSQLVPVSLITTSDTHTGPTGGHSGPDAIRFMVGFAWTDLSRLLHKVTGGGGGPGAQEKGWKGGEDGGDVGDPWHSWTYLN